MENREAPEIIIDNKILTIRRVRVMLDYDLAQLYGVSTKRLNEQVKRNIARFPSDFVFQLTKQELTEVVANCDHLRRLKFSSRSPNAFTEHGVAMLSSVLRSEKAVQMNIFIVRAFVKVRNLIDSSKDVVLKIQEIERKQTEQENILTQLVSIIQNLVDEPSASKEKIGFRNH